MRRGEGLLDGRVSASLDAARSERRFGEAALRLAGVAGLLLGWRPGEFWEATPAELAAVLGAFAAPAEGMDSDELRRLRERFPDG